MNDPGDKNMVVDRTGRVTKGSQPLGFRFESALAFAFRLHAEQLRKGSGTAYIAHLLGVAAIVIEAGGDENEAIAALLHDAVEDQGGDSTLVTIRHLFGDQVGDIVASCSDGLSSDDPRDGTTWLARKLAYLEHLRAAPTRVLRVSLADKIYNARQIVVDPRIDPDGFWGRFDKDGAPGTAKTRQLWYYGELAETFTAAPNLGSLRAWAEELDDTGRRIELITGSTRGAWSPTAKQ